MDAENMEFGNNTFDFVWTWGVIHHSSNTRRVLSEMSRVLRTGGAAITMVYHRNFWNWYIIGILFRGIVKGDLLRAESIHKAIQLSTDGAIARWYSIQEWRTLVSEFFRVKDILVLGSKSHIIPLPGGRVKNTVETIFPSYLSRFLTNKCKLGGFLISILTKDT
jgi:ubiquinone/menaquinone biosynthesis C-methylase UbiE